MTEILSKGVLRSTTVMFLFVWFSGIWMGGCETQEQKVEKLIKQLQDDVEIRHYAIWELVEIGKDAVPFLIQALQDAGEGKNGSVIRLSVVEVLVKIGKDAVPDLIQALQDADLGVCVNVTTALGWIGEGAISAVPSLIQLLQDKDAGSDVRANVATALGWIGGGAQDTVPSLIQALQDQDAGVCQGVVEALENIDTPEALKAVEEYESRQ